MQTPSPPDIWIVLWPVIIGGVLAILPTMFGQVAVHFFAQRSAKILRARKQFMKLAEAVAGYEDWITKRHHAKAFGGPEPGASPLPLIVAIASLDFPILLEAIYAMASPALKFELWQNRAALKRLGGNSASLNEGFDAAYRPFLAALSKLKEDLRVVGVSLNDA